LSSIIWTYWHQGLVNAPFVVKQCTERLRHLHPSWDVRLLDKENVYDFADTVDIKSEKWDKLKIQHRSDLLRTQFLIKYGGVWLDPTVFCLQTLDSWLPDNMDNGLFLFNRPGNDRIIANWFIAAEKDNYLLIRLYESLIEYWNNNEFRNLVDNNNQLARKAHRWIDGRNLMLSQVWLTSFFTKTLRIYPYMIYHYMFYYLVRTDSRCRAIYEAMPKVSADGPHYLLRKGLLNPLDDNSKKFIDHKSQPVQKLKWKIPDESLEGTNLEYLFSQNQ
jgi:hypothetical protein